MSGGGGYSQGYDDDDEYGHTTTMDGATVTEGGPTSGGGTFSDYDTHHRDERRGGQGTTESRPKRRSNRRSGGGRHSRSSSNYFSTEGGRAGPGRRSDGSGSRSGSDDGRDHTTTAEGGRSPRRGGSGSGSGGGRVNGKHGGAAEIRRTSVAVKVESVYSYEYLSYSDGDGGGGGGGSGGRRFRSGSTAVEPVMLRESAAFVERYLDPFLRVSERIGSYVCVHAALLETAVLAIHEFLAVVASRPRRKPPSRAAVRKLLKPATAAQRMVVAYADNRKHSRWGAHTSAIGELVLAFSWVQSNHPMHHVELAGAGAEFFLAYIEKTHHDEPLSRRWVGLARHLLTGLRVYVARYHGSGLNWVHAHPRSRSPRIASPSCSLSEHSSDEEAILASRPHLHFSNNINHNTGNGSNHHRTAVGSIGGRSLSSLRNYSGNNLGVGPGLSPNMGGSSSGRRKGKSKGKAAGSSGRRHTRSKSYDIPMASVASSPIGSRTMLESIAHVPAIFRSSGAEFAGAPRIGTDGGGGSGGGGGGGSGVAAEVSLAHNTWLVSNQYGERNLRVKETDGRLVVIRNCHRTTVRLPEGTRHVTLESCTSVSLLVHGVADSVDVVNSRGIKLVCRGPVAAIDIESSFGVRITLRSEDAPGTAIYAAYSGGVTVTLEARDHADDEHALPDRFVTTFAENGRVVTNAVPTGVTSGLVHGSMAASTSVTKRRVPRPREPSADSSDSPSRRRSRKKRSKDRKKDKKKRKR